MSAVCDVQVCCVSAVCDADRCSLICTGVLCECCV